MTPAGQGPRFCTTCGHELAPGKRFCTSCGTAVPGVPGVPAPPTSLAPSTPSAAPTQRPPVAPPPVAPVPPPAWGTPVGPGAPSAVPLPAPGVLPQHQAPAVPVRRRRRPLLVVAVALVLLVVAVGAGWGVGRLIAGDDGESGATTRAAGDPSIEPAEGAVDEPDVATSEPAASGTSTAPGADPTSTPDPTPSPTPSATPTVPGTGPLGTGVDLTYRNLPRCDGSFIVVVSSSITPGRYLRDLKPAFDAVGRNGRYLSGGRTCPGFHVNDDGSATYVVYLGPFDTRAQACAARAPILDRYPQLTGAYVRQLNGDTSVLRLASLCSCEQPPSQIPPLSRGNAYDAVDTLKARVYDLQVLLNRDGYVGTDSVTGVFGDVTKAAVRRYQRDHYLYETGVVTRDTWQSLQDNLC